VSVNEFILIFFDFVFIIFCLAEFRNSAGGPPSQKLWRVNFGRRDPQEIGFELGLFWLWGAAERSKLALFWV